LLVLSPFLLRVLRREGWPATEPEPALEQAT
jgi:hypothetical protein